MDEKENTHAFQNDFNSPFEIGLRMLIILMEAFPTKLDLQRLIYYDYFILHTSDVQVEGSPLSIHPDTPHRFGELIVRRQVMQQGLDLMYSKSLIEIIFDEDGINYSASPLTVSFLNLFTTEYFKTLKLNAKWVTSYYSTYSQLELQEFVGENIGRWGGEFMYEALIRGGIE